jgi:hypothetical protein
LYNDWGKIQVFVYRNTSEYQFDGIKMMKKGKDPYPEPNPDPGFSSNESKHWLHEGENIGFFSGGGGGRGEKYGFRTVA